MLAWPTDAELLTCIDYIAVPNGQPLSAILDICIAKYYKKDSLTFGVPELSYYIFAVAARARELVQRAERAFAEAEVRYRQALAEREGIGMVS